MGLLEQMMGMEEKSHRGEDKSLPMPVSSPEDLRGRLGLLMNTQVFVVGDIVQWKPGMQNRKFPAYGGKVIVTEIFAEPTISTNESGSRYFREPIDIKLGILWNDGDFYEYGFDSRRFEKVAE